jgi:hypothetical protein
MRRQRLWLNLKQYQRIRLEGPRKTTKNIGQHSRPLGRDLKPGLPEYEAVVLNTLKVVVARDAESSITRIVHSYMCMPVGTGFALNRK